MKKNYILIGLVTSVFSFAQSIQGKLSYENKNKFQILKLYYLKEQKKYPVLVMLKGFLI